MAGSVDVSAWPPGVYVIRTMGPRGVRSERLIVSEFVNVVQSAHETLGGNVRNV